MLHMKNNENLVVFFIKQTEKVEVLQNKSYIEKKCGKRENFWKVVYPTFWAYEAETRKMEY